MNKYQLSGTILGDAFLHYSLHLYAFKNKLEEERRKGIKLLYTHCSKAASKYGGVVFTEDQKGALIWLSAEYFPLSILGGIKSGMAILPFKIGADTMIRYMKHDAVSEGWISKHAGKKMGYIWVLGVTDSHRGKGYSRILIENAIEEMKAKGLDEFWLKTEDPKNVLIYQKLGFKVMHETLVKSSGLTSWIMKK